MPNRSALTWSTNNSDSESAFVLEGLPHICTNLFELKIGMDIQFITFLMNFKGLESMNSSTTGHGNLYENFGNLKLTKISKIVINRVGGVCQV